MEYLKIADGCDKKCTYCAIPYFKGKYKSVPMEAVVQEAKVLSEAGVKELVIVAQETTCYGIDLYGAVYYTRAVIREQLQKSGMVMPDYQTQKSIKFNYSKS